jgi:hypothetical protein
LHGTSICPLDPAAWFVIEAVVATSSLRGPDGKFAIDELHDLMHSGKVH